MKEHFRNGDTLIISDVDRLGRNADDVIVEIKDLQLKGIRVVALDVPFLNDWKKMNDDSLSKMIIDILWSTGVPKEFVKEYNKFQSGEYGSISVVQFTKLQGIAVSTFYKYAGILKGQ